GWMLRRSPNSIRGRSCGGPGAASGIGAGGGAVIVTAVAVIAAAGGVTAAGGAVIAAGTGSTTGTGAAGRANVGGDAGLVSRALSAKTERSALLIPATPARTASVSVHADMSVERIASSLSSPR